MLVNRSLSAGSGRRFGVNPGVSPARIAAFNRRAVPTFQVRPRVLAGTQGIPGAVQVQRDQLSAGAPRGPRPQSGPRRPSGANAVTVQRTSASIAPAATVPPQQPLGKGERGRLGTHPPRAVQGAPPPTVAPADGAGDSAGPWNAAATTRWRTAAARPATPAAAARRRNAAATAAAELLRRAAATSTVAAAAGAPPPPPGAAPAGAASAATAAACRRSAAETAGRAAAASDAAAAPHPPAAVRPPPPPPRRHRRRRRPVAPPPPPAAVRAPPPPAPNAPPPAAAPKKPDEKPAEPPKYRGCSKQNGRPQGPPVSHAWLTPAPQRTSTFLNCQGSRLSMSSGNSPGRSVSGVQSV